MNNPEKFAGIVSDICSHSQLVLGRPLRWTIIANPKAGGFTIRSRWKKNEAAMNVRAGFAASQPKRQDGSGPSILSLDSLSKSGLITTNRPGHADEIVKSLLSEVEKDDTGAFFLIITAGGDGTSLEVQRALYHAPEESRSRCAVLRLPMGTGNDGSDGPELEDAINLLIKPARITNQRAVRIRTATAGKGPFLAFNILSIGIDAFITHMTNKMKGALPGDSYKLWVDIASLFYDLFYKVGPMQIEAFDGAGNKAASFNEPMLLTAVGVSGGRTYGSKNLILPDTRNVCSLRQMSVFRKLSLKKLFKTGTHVDKPEAELYNAERIEFQYKNPILVQMDGETVLLKPEDFPAVIELTEALIQVLKPL